jgi:hypothetical protein
MATHRATQVKKHFSELVEAIVASGDIKMDVQAKARQMFLNTVCKYYLLDNVLLVVLLVAEVCNFGRYPDHRILWTTITNLATWQSLLGTQ